MITRNGDKLQVAGPLTLHTVKALYDRGLQANGSKNLVVDLSQVEAVDSSGVSLLLSWLREAQRSDINVCFTNIPDNLMSLARLYGVADVLPVCGGSAA
ncbi:MAG TPA: STAS domain-containing protein [Gallionellaceae bacterium]